MTQQTAICFVLLVAAAVNSMFQLTLQVFEYLDTDLKRFMDKNGKGPSHPLPAKLIKVNPLKLCQMTWHCLTFAVLS